MTGRGPAGASVCELGRALVRQPERASDATTASGASNLIGMTFDIAFLLTDLLAQRRRRLENHDEVEQERPSPANSGFPARIDRFWNRFQNQCF
jgi:hypothetical protein